LLHSSRVGVADSLIRYLAIEGPRLAGHPVRAANNSLAT
jgi:hypothetical protein